MQTDLSKNKPARVAVVAAGVVSPLGAGLGATLAALREARDCVSPVTSFRGRAMPLLHRRAGGG